MEVPKEDDLTELCDAIGRSSEERTKSTVRLFLSDLSHHFSSEQIVPILRGYWESGKFETMAALDAVTEAEQLNNLWRAKSWTEDQTESFQIGILTKPEWEGVSQAFASHPAYHILMGATTTERFDPWEPESRPAFVSAYRRTEPGLSLQNDNNKSYIVFTEEPDPEPTEVIRDPYEVYEDLVEDCEEIEMMAAHAKKGILFVYGTRLLSGTAEALSSKFDLLRAFRVDQDCVIRLEIGRTQDSSKPLPKWVRDVDVYQNIWYNFAEKLLPLSGARLNLKISLLSAEVEPVNVKIMGVCLTEAERETLARKLESGGFDPYANGFRPHFKLKV